MKQIYFFKIIFFVFTLTYAVDGKFKDAQVPPDPFQRQSVAKIGDNPFPTNPMSDRAKGFIDQGRVKSAITNYGSFINWDVHPSGIWGDYSYLPAVSFIGAVPGHKNTAEFSWENLETIIDSEGVPIYSVWESSSAYDDWYPLTGDTTYKGILFELGNDIAYTTRTMKNILLMILILTCNFILIMRIERLS